MSLGTRLGTARALGFGNLARVLSYRLLLRTGLHPVQHLEAATGATPPQGPFFSQPTTRRTLPPTTAWRTHGAWFGWFRPELEGTPPDWHANPFDGRRVTGAGEPWWTLPDFDPSVGDIKAIWEASRLDWAVAFATQAAAGDTAALERLNWWLADWSARNPPYRGPNWKCAQEASIRVLHLALAALVLSQVNQPAPDLLALLRLHLHRIEPTTGYARGQENNHGTSEAAALFVGGGWLAALQGREGSEWRDLGRHMLEERVEHLVAPDGSFSQYSVTYHRLMLDTLSLAEVWRRLLRLPDFSPTFRDRAAAAAAWLRSVVHPATGGAPLLGHHDGSNLLPLTDAGPQDLRASVELGSTLFEQLTPYPIPAWPAQLAWLGVTPVTRVADPPGSTFHPDGGLAILVVDGARAFFRFPRYRFRPSHADALHLDLWVGDENLLRDGGTFSYAEEEWQRYFAGARGHNGIQFDGREQMPRLGRFLWGDWLQTDALETPAPDGAGVRAAASYRDRWGAHHARAVRLLPRRLEVTDWIEGFRSSAVLRWRLRPGTWTLAGATVSDGRVRLEIATESPPVRVELVEGWESRHYLAMQPIPVLEVEVSRPGGLTTVCRWGA